MFPISDDAPRSTTPYVNYLLIILNILVFIFEVSLVPRDEATFVACMVGNLHAAKDHLTLLRAWQLVVDRLEPLGKKPVLLLAGRLDSMADRVKALAFDLRLHDSVQFLGLVEDIAGLLEAVDLGVFCSPKESCPNGVLECMAVGLPVVASDIAGVREVVGESGLAHLAPPEDAVTLAERIVGLAMNPALCESLSKINRERIATHYSIERMGESMTKIIADALTR